MNTLRTGPNSQSDFTIVLLAYAGGRLLPLLLSKGRPVRCLTRRAVSESSFNGKNIVVVGIALDEHSLNEALEGAETAYYLIHSMGGILSRKQVENCRLGRERADVHGNTWRWVVNIELTEETKAELRRRFRALRPRKTYWWKPRLNGEHWYGAESTFHQTADPSTRFAEVAVFTTKNRCEAERVKQSFLEPAKPLAHFQFNNGPGGTSQNTEKE